MINRVHLQKILDDCNLILKYVEEMNSTSDKEYAEKIDNVKKAIRKITIANEMMGRTVIAVTGMQGMGKSTLMKNFYGLSSKYFAIDSGRGERIPVFITETDGISEPEMYRCVLKANDNGDFEFAQEKVDSEESFCEYAKAKDENTSVMYLELKVPRKYTISGEKISFALLPGFEMKNDYWRELIEISVKCSDTAIFVVNPTSNASRENSSVLQDIKKTFEDCNIIYALSFSDVSPDNNDEFKTTIMEDIGAYQDQVICTGDFSEHERNEQWIEQLQKAINKYLNSDGKVNENCRKHISDIIRSEIRPELRDIQKIAENDNAAFYTQLDNNEYLKIFDQSCNKQRKKFVNALDKKLNEAKSEDMKSWEENISHIDLNNIKRQIFGYGVKDEQKIMNLIESSMKKDDVFRFQKSFAEALIDGRKSIIDEDSDSNVKIALLANKSGEANGENEIKALNLVHDTKIILGDNDDNKEKGVLKSTSYSEISKFIAEAGTMYLTEHILCSTPKIDEKSFGKSELSNDKIRGGIKDTTMFAGTLIGITGLDLVGDGVMNMIPSIGAALGISTVAAGTIAAGIVGVGLAVTTIRDLNQMQLQDMYAGRRVINQIYEKIKTEYINTFDDKMQLLREKMEEHLIERTGQNKKLISKYNLNTALLRAVEDINGISRELNRDETIADIFKG